MSSFKKTVLPNGIRVVSERHFHSRAVSLGIWVDTGTRDEEPGVEGISHFIEHLVFKGTKNRSAYRIVRDLEALGGDLNAYTSKEQTCYHSLILKDHWRTSLDVLADLASNMKISNKDFTLEKGVILQEIAMAEDNHEDVAYETLFQGIYRGHALANPILGNLKSITEMKLSSVMRRYRAIYQGGSLVVSAAGDIDHDELVAAVSKLFRQKRVAPKTPRRRAPRWKRTRSVVEKESEQIHCLLGFPTVSFRDSRRFESFILNAALGGGMTSRLYQAVRERKGLVYNIHSSLHTMTDAGLITIYAGADREKVPQVTKIVAQEMRRLREKGISKADVNLFKTQVIGGILLGSEDIENRMTSLGLNEIVFGKYKAVDEVVDEVRAIDQDRVNAFVQEYLRPEKMSGVLVGTGVEELRSWWNEQEF